jgi:predicted nucleic acid-binding protein
MPYIADTHALIWFFTNSRSLGQTALDILREADAGREVIMIPTIVLAEVMSICKSGKAPLDFATTWPSLKPGITINLFPLI